MVDHLKRKQKKERKGKKKRGKKNAVWVSRQSRDDNSQIIA